MVEPATLGDPMRPLLWVSKSHEKLADALQKKGHEVSASSVKRLLPTLGYSRQSNRKADEGSKHPDRNAQFEHINAKVIAAQAAGQPVISVDTKKKELVGNYKNGGTDYRPKGDPQRVKVHDFEDKELGKVVPYGVYDIAANAGWVSVGIDNDTAQFAVASIRRWLDAMGRARYPDTRELTITADGGGSNGSRVRLWKVELQKLADTTGLALHVHHYPPGTSKWNKIEHRLFCHITQSWRARPLTDRLAVVELIAATTTRTGLKVESALDTATYEKGIKVSDAEMKALDIQGDPFHPEWNYTSVPDRPQNRAVNLTNVLSRSQCKCRGRAATCVPRFEEYRRVDRAERELPRLFYAPFYAPMPRARSASRASRSPCGPRPARPTPWPPCKPRRST